MDYKTIIWPSASQKSFKQGPKGQNDPTKSKSKEGNVYQKKIIVFIIELSSKQISTELKPPRQPYGVLKISKLHWMGQN